MNKIIRDISVTSKSMTPRIDVTKGTNMIPIELNVTDFIIPNASSATAYVTPIGATKARTLLGSVKGNTLIFNPTSNLFDEGQNEMNVRITNAAKTLVTFKLNVICEPSTEFGDAVEEAQTTLVQQLLDANAKERNERINADKQLDVKTSNNKTSITALEGRVTTIETNATALEKRVAKTEQDLTISQATIDKFTNLGMK